MNNCDPKTAARMLTAARKAARAECKDAFMAVTEPAFRTKVIRHKNGGKTIKHAMKGGRGYCILPDGTVKQASILYFAGNECVWNICLRHAKVLFEETGLLKIEAFNGKEYFFDPSQHSGHDGDYGFFAYIYVSLLEGWRSRVERTGQIILRKALFKEMDQEVMHLAYLSGAAFSKIGNTADNLNHVVANLKFYRQVYADCPAALGLFHRSLLWSDLRSPILSVFKPPCSLRQLTDPLDSLSWTRSVFMGLGCSAQSWRYLLSCGPVERTAWLGALSSSEISPSGSTFFIINALVESNTPICLSAIREIQTQFRLYQSTDFKHYIALFSLAVVASMKHIHSRVRHQKLKKAKISVLINSMRLWGISDFIRHSDVPPTPPKGCGYPWWNKKQREWHADAAIRAAQLEPELHDWLDIYPENIRRFEQEDTVAVIMSNTVDYIKEGIEMNHCVADYLSAAMKGNAICYSIRQGEQRATLRLYKNDESCRFVECRGERNHAVPDTVMKFAKNVAREVGAAPPITRT